MLFTLVRNLDGFKELNRESLWHVVTSSSYESFTNGQTVYAVSEKTNDIYVILSGGVKVVMDGVSIAFLTDRDLFGHLEVALLHSRRLATIIASEDTKVVRIPRHVYTTMWPQAGQHKDDIKFLQQLPGMGKATPKNSCHCTTASQRRRCR
jgi:signal-transduction protein with cAMP-binding, CBS, and nucleotidyltransferase domain